MEGKRMEKHIAGQQDQKESWNGYTNIRKKQIFKPKVVTSAKEGHFTMIKGSVPLEDLTHTNIYVVNKRATKCRIKGRKSTIIVRDFNIPLSIMDRITREKINREIEDLNSTINQWNLTETTEYSTQQ